MSQRLTLRRFGFGVGFIVVAGVAAANSYEHMRDLALLGHQPESLAATLPLSVDGLLLIASMAMAEDKAQNRYPRAWARFAFWFGAAISVAANIAATAVHYGDWLSISVSAWPPIALLVAVEIVARPGKPKPVSPAISDEITVPDTVAEIESDTLPEAQVSPAISGTPQAPAAVKGGRGEYGPRNGETYSERHDRRRRNGR